MVYPPPSAHAYHQRSQLEAASKYQQVDIYTLDAPGMVELWLATKQSEGVPKEEAIKQLNDLTGLSVTQETLGFAQNYGSTIKSSLLLATLGKDLARSGSLFTQYYITTKNGKQYIIFKGNHKLRKIIKGTRYLATNTQMMKFGIGGKAAKAAARSGFLVSVIFSVSLNSIRWLFDEEFRWTHWITHLSTDVLKIAIASIAGYLAAVGVAAGAAVFAASIPVILPITVGIFVALVVGEGLSILDQDNRLAKKLLETIEDYEKKIGELDETLLDGVYYTVEEGKKFAIRQMRLLFLSKVRMLRQRLAPRWF
ncbi:hypothetical protein [Marinimicrobium locisalis]|uniref:hypothetical protein n=1 Tax=Marinimicrobium locisalis TaxID=546022 RepID=UPI00322140C5